MTLFGPAGNSDAFTKKFKGSVFAPAWLREMGLDCYEYQCGRGVNIGEDTARAIGAAASAHGIHMSLHAPYFINLSGSAPERMEKNLGYILQSARAVSWMGGDRIVVHCGGLSGMTREEALANTAAGLHRAADLLAEEHLGHVTMCVETMGKINVLGDLSEVLALCRGDGRLLPCIDFGHMNARTQGQMRTLSQVTALFDALEDALGIDRARHLHAHFSRIEYGKGGEVRHLTFEDTVYGPDFGPVALQLAKRGYAARVICESAGTQAEDALTMKKMYTDYLK
ncbi:MAG: TIM barrel protein [Clostridiaceae bacterium]|nr:TIM barrel protein [Clostridiaceae bacterium]